ncbi:hypothetical protein AMTR_s00109p00147370 [Amborella trichopoda]|uniref:Uncharacterized protein n=1 Tax=Amborella trichopoda TaxID=13333 RepID=W1NPN4_AMBTC|nr:hypothetical protein AMTR_s00109p00147370 [Amborella trichopoda]
MVANLEQERRDSVFLPGYRYLEGYLQKDCGCFQLGNTVSSPEDVCALNLKGSTAWENHPSEVPVRAVAERSPPLCNR